MVSDYFHVSLTLGISPGVSPHFHCTNLTRPFSRCFAALLLQVYRPAFARSFSISHSACYPPGLSSSYLTRPFSVSLDRTGLPELCSAFVTPTIGTQTVCDLPTAGRAQPCRIGCFSLAPNSDCFDCTRIAQIKLLRTPSRP